MTDLVTRLRDLARTLPPYAAKEVYEAANAIESAGLVIARAHRDVTDPNGVFEDEAEAFYRATGFMAPGKDRAAAMGTEDREEARKAWREWCLARDMNWEATVREAARALGIE